MIKSLEVKGLRGFATNHSIEFALPTGEYGSGLTAIVGANNTGKSTIIEALRALTQRQPPSFGQGRRNIDAGDEIYIAMVDQDGKKISLRSLRAGSSETQFDPENENKSRSNFLILPARRFFNPFFGKGELNRRSYMDQFGFPPIRTTNVDQFSRRLFKIARDPGKFNSLLKRVIDPVPNWTIDQQDTGQYFLKISKGQASHSSEGLGEGLVSLFYIIDALYDSEDGDVIAIDEPELSLHPALQRKLSRVLSDHARTRQIIVSTHSPYFVPLEALPNGATVIRTHLNSDSTCCISQLDSKSSKSIFGLMKNDNNPHVLGLLAQEIFFVEDKIILVEGQEDVVFMSKVSEQVGKLNGTFFGWGVGGASNMKHITTILQKLGYLKVVGILDGNEQEHLGELKGEFPNYHFFAIPANDIRTKKAVPKKDPVEGLLDDDNSQVQPKYKEETERLFANANEYLQTQ